MKIGERIGIFAENKGMSLRQVALQANIPYNTLYSIVKRKSDRIDAETLRDIARALECDFYWLLWGEHLSTSESVALDVMRLYATDDPYIEKAARTAAHFTERKYLDEGYSLSDLEKQLVSHFSHLNDEGQQEAVKRIEELTEIPKYQRTEEEKK